MNSELRTSIWILQRGYRIAIDGAGTHDYTYDTRDRLTAATHPNLTNESYTLDDVGNRTASHQGSSYTYQAFNRLTDANSNTFSYNPNGNLTSKTDASGSWTYTWDYENRLKQASKSGGVTITYAYDALGRRVQRTHSAGGTTKFVYDGPDVVRDLDGNGATIADYLNGPGIDNKLRQTAGGIVSYFATDHLGTTRALTDASGSLTSTLSYDSFGNVTSGSSPSRYTYTGREIDSDTGLMYYRARFYDPQQGRFISQDPIGLEGGINVFAYVENNPLRFTDPSGLCPNLKTPYVDQDVLNSCTQDYFGVTTNSFTGSSSGNNGAFQGTGPSYLATNQHGAGNNDTFTIRNNATSYSTSYLTNLDNQFRIAAGQSPNPPGVTILGTTNRFAPLTNYTGNNLGPMQTLRTQVHELGHSLGVITGIGYDSLKDDWAGQILEDCVRRRGGFKYK